MRGQPARLVRGGVPIRRQAAAMHDVTGTVCGRRGEGVRMKAKRIRVVCLNARGDVIAEGRSRNTANAHRLAQWLLDNAYEAVRAAVPSTQYEIVT